MVLRVCRNVLGDSTDAEDAFQATFLVLVRRCGSIRRLESLGSWLYGVACRVAARARVDAAKRRSAERRGALRVVQTVDSSGAGEPDRTEFGTVIQEEVRRLPENYRAVVALCYWEGLTQEQAATQLGCPLGTVRSRLARARNRLHRRLTRRGLAPLAGIVAAALDSPSAEAARLSLVPSPLIRSTVTASAQILAGRAVERRGFHVRRRPDSTCPQEHVDDEIQNGGRCRWCSSVSELMERVWRHHKPIPVSRRMYPDAARIRLRRSRNPRLNPPSSRWETMWSSLLT